MVHDAHAQEKACGEARRQARTEAQQTCGRLGSHRLRLVDVPARLSMSPLSLAGLALSSHHKTSLVHCLGTCKACGSSTFVLSISSWKQQQQCSSSSGGGGGGASLSSANTSLLPHQDTSLGQHLGACHTCVSCAFALSNVRICGAIIRLAPLALLVDPSPSWC